MVSNEDRQKQGCTDKRQETVWEGVGRDRERSKKTYFRLQDVQRSIIPGCGVQEKVIPGKASEFCCLTIF